MTTKEFFQGVKDELYCESEIAENTDFSTIKEWDSLGKLSVISFIDQNFSVLINAQQIDEIRTGADLIKFVENKLQN